MFDTLKTVLSRIGDFWSVVIDLIGIACCYGVCASLITGTGITSIWQDSLGWLGVSVDFAGNVNSYISSHVPVFFGLGLVLLLGLAMPILSIMDAIDAEDDSNPLKISNLLADTYIAVVWIAIALFDVSNGISGVVFALGFSVVFVSVVIRHDDGSLPHSECIKNKRSERMRRLLLSVALSAFLVFMWPVGCLLALLWRLFGL